MGTTIVREENLTGATVEIDYEVIQLDEFNPDKEYLKERYLMDLYKNDGLRNIFESKGIGVLESDFKCGGFGVVCSCKNGSVIKFSSSKRLAIEEIANSDGYFDLKNKPETGEEVKQSGILNEIFSREAFVYELLSEKEKKSVAAPFIVAVCVGDKICDYLNCVNMPRYTPVSEVMKKFDETEVLKMTKDVLECLQKVHNKGIRHRDIKTDNIMYNSKTGKYVLIDWGASNRYFDGGMEKAVFNIDNIYGTVWSNYYVDPVRIKNEQNNRVDAAEPATDLYSLGVIMAYFAHEKGYFSNNSISEFHNEVCGDSYIGKEPVIDGEIFEQISASDEFKAIVNKAMNHNVEQAYVYAADMIDDIKQLISEETSDDRDEPVVIVPSKPKKRIKIPAFIGDVLICAMLVLYTMIISGTDGLKTAGGSVGVIICVVSGLLTTISVLYRILIKDEQNWYIEANLSTVLYSLILFLALSLTTSYFLQDLNEIVTIDLTFIQYTFVLLTIFVVSKIQIKNPLMDRLIENLACGCLCGMCVGLCIAFKIAEGNFANVFSGGMIKLIGLLAFCGLLFGAAVYLIWFKKYVTSDKGHE